MKRTVMLAAGAVTLGAVVLSSLWAQQPAGSQKAARAAEPRTRIALLNLHFVIKHYGKYQAFQDEMKKVVAPYQEKDQKWRKEAEALNKGMQDPATPVAKREENERQLKELQRKLEDNKAEFNHLMGKKSDEQLKILYMDVQEAAQRYAVSHNFDLVLHYNDATTSQEYYTPMNIARKMQTPACMPMYAAAGMDISQEVLMTLNAGYNRSATRAPAGAPATAGGQH